MPCCATTNPGPTPRSERRSHGCHTGRDELRLKAVSRRRRGRDSARLEPALDAANPSAITSTLDVQDSRSLQAGVRPTARSLIRAYSLAHRGRTERCLSGDRSGVTGLSGYETLAELPNRKRAQILRVLV